MNSITNVKNLKRRTLRCCGKVDLSDKIWEKTEAFLYLWRTFMRNDDLYKVFNVKVIAPVHGLWYIPSGSLCFHLESRMLVISRSNCKKGRYIVIRGSLFQQVYLTPLYLISGPLFFLCGPQCLLHGPLFPSVRTCVGPGFSSACPCFPSVGLCVPPVGLVCPFFGPLVPSVGLCFPGTWSNH